MDQLKCLRVFVQVVADGSFAGAARHLDIAPAVATRALAASQLIEDRALVEFVDPRPRIPHLDAQVTSRFPSLKLQSSNALTLPLASVVIGVLIGPLPGTALHTSPSWAGPVITGTAFTMLLLALLLGSTIINIIRSKGRDVAV